MNVLSFARAAMRMPRLCRNFYVRPGAGHADQLSAIGLPETDAHNLPVQLSFSLFWYICIWVTLLVKPTDLNLFGNSFAAPSISNSTLVHIVLPTTVRIPQRLSQMALSTAWKFLVRKESPPFGPLLRSRCILIPGLAFIKTSS